MKNNLLNDNMIVGNTSRFKNDFILNKILSSGGGCVVYEVQNIYDGMHYTIKKVINYIYKPFKKLR